MFENRVLRYLVYGSSTIFFAEVVGLTYFWWKKRKLENEKMKSKNIKPDARASSTGEITEVIWTNEMTLDCPEVHSHNAIHTKYGCVIDNEDEGDLCPNKFCQKYSVGRLIQLIDKTKYGIDLAMYTFTSVELFNALSRAHSRGVVLRIISDREMAYSTGSQMHEVAKLGIPIRCPSSANFMHHKFLILDGNKRVEKLKSYLNNKFNQEIKVNQIKGIVISGSLNWTMQGFAGNWENSIITSNKKIVDSFEMEFQRMWDSFSSTI